MINGIVKREFTKPMAVWLVLISLTLVSAALAESSADINSSDIATLAQHSLAMGNISLLLVGAIVLVKGNLVIDHFMGLKHTTGWPQRIMKGYLMLMLLLIGSCFVYY